MISKGGQIGVWLKSVPVGEHYALKLSWTVWS